MENSNNLYDTDYQQWAEQQKQFLQSGQLDRLDIKNLLAELGQAVKNNRRSLKSGLKILILHLLKVDYQLRVLQDPWVQDKVIHTWLPSINNPRSDITDLLADSPSLKHHLTDAIAQSYPMARAEAVEQMNKYIHSPQKRLTASSFPDTCPWTFEQLMSLDLYP